MHNSRGNNNFFNKRKKLSKVSEIVVEYFSRSNKLANLHIHKMFNDNNYIYDQSACN